MKKFLAGISKSILYFFGGIFFTLFLFSVLVVVYLYNENIRLKNEIKGINNNSFNMEPKDKIEKLIPETIIDDEPEVRPQPVPKGIIWQNWNNVKMNMTADEVVNLLGNPSQVISMIDETKYIYKDERNEGTINFNRIMRVISINR